MQTWMKIAQGLIGTREVKGRGDNPVIMEMYAAVGHDWVEHDEVAWCAAFVGYCLEKAGFRSTRKLTARSYLDYGEKVDNVRNAVAGDIVVFKRGNSDWQGHVAFYVSQTKSSIKVLGGNQADAVNIRSYPKSKLLGIRRVMSADRAPTIDVKGVQAKLKSLGYHEVGNVDGMMGPRTRAAILAFKADNGLGLTPDIDSALLTAMETADHREIGEARATGKPENSRILSGANVQMASGGIGAAMAIGAQVGQTVDQAEQANNVVERGLSLLGLYEMVAPYLPFIAAAIFITVFLIGWRIRKARIEDYRTGRTP